MHKGVNVSRLSVEKNINYNYYSMFDYPLPKPIYNNYQKLGISPEASSEEIREAIEDYKKKLSSEKTRLLKLSKKESEPEKTDENSGSIITGFESDYQDEINKIEKEILELGSIKILGKNQIEYDLEHPPCALLKLEKEIYPIFSKTENQSKETLFFLRKEISDFLERKGMFCYHPTDLTRTDFNNDFIVNDFLDKE